MMIKPLAYCRISQFIFASNMVTVNLQGLSIMSEYPQFVHPAESIHDYSQSPAFFLIMPACDPMEMYATACTCMGINEGEIEVVVIDHKLGRDTLPVADLLHLKYNGRFHLVRPNQD